MNKPLLEVKNLVTKYKINNEFYPVVDQISFELSEKETLCIVGESGCGKSVTALSIMGLIPKRIGKITNGTIKLKGREYLDDKEIMKIRGNEISMIFQEPMTSLNPVFTIGSQIAEAITNHRDVSKKEAMEMAKELLRRVGISDVETRIKKYPFELSGGMRQRVMIAMALACNPKLLIADEPTTALDVTVQAQIIELMKELRESTGTSVIFITHDLGVVADIADRVAVMYSGSIVEMGDVYQIFSNPQHPYTEGLLKSIPNIYDTRKELPIIEGTISTPNAMPQGCKFSPRCPYATKICLQKRPSLKEMGNGHSVACWHSNELKLKGVGTGDDS